VSDERLAKDVRSAALTRRVGAKQTPRAAMEQAADMIEALTIALKANTFGSEWRGVFVEVEDFTRRLRDAAEEASS
jgi:hypothetical protein